MINYMYHSHTVEEKKRVFFSPSFGRNVIFKVCCLKAYECLAKSFSRVQRNPVLSYSVNVNMGRWEAVTRQ